MSKKKSVLDVELDEYEQEIEDDFDKLVPISREKFVKMKEHLRTAVFCPISERGEHQVMVEIHPDDVKPLKKMASKKGETYQNFIAKILHKFVAGRLKDVKSS